MGSLSKRRSKRANTQLEALNELVGGGFIEIWLSKPRWKDDLDAKIARLIRSSDDRKQAIPFKSFEKFKTKGWIECRDSNWIKGLNSTVEHYVISQAGLEYLDSVPGN